MFIPAPTLEARFADNSAGVRVPDGIILMIGTMTTKTMTMRTMMTKDREGA
jgi:hypothetical protein